VEACRGLVSSKSEWISRADDGISESAPSQRAKTPDVHDEALSQRQLLHRPNPRLIPVVR